MDFIDYYGVVQNTIGLITAAATIVSLVVFRAGMVEPSNRYVLKNRIFKTLGVTAATGFAILFVVGG